jgi:hypothetical protein
MNCIVSLFSPISKLCLRTEACTTSALHLTKFSSTISAKLGSPDSSVSMRTRLGLEDMGSSRVSIKGILFFFRRDIPVMFNDQ